MVDHTDPAFWGFSTGWQWTHEDFYLQRGFAQDDLVYPLPDLALEPEQTNHDFQENDSHALPVSIHEAPLPQAADSLGSLLPGDGVSLRNSAVSTPSLRTVLGTMVEDATTAHFTAMSAKWEDFSKRLTSFISTRGGQSPRSPKPHLLDGLVEQYFDHFHPLWPFVPSRDTSRDVLHPLLYLTLTSIGALYSGTNAAARYGSILHGMIREVLLRSERLRDQTTESEALDIGRSMLLTQVAALYFEQDGAFSAAQRLGATLSDHAQRMRLFALKPATLFHRHQHDVFRPIDNSMLQGRKMLAFGIMRAETFMSVLFNKKPLISYEEINLPLPSPNHAREVFHAISGSESVAEQRTEMLFSDLVRIALDEDEVLPALKPVDVELLLFGLQHEVWRFSHDPDIFKRLIQTARPVLTAAESGLKSAPDHLDCTGRRMRSLQNDYLRVIKALDKWKAALTHCQLSHSLPENRSIYLSALILYELSFLRLCAPLNSIQQTAYRLHEPSASDTAVAEDITAWTFTPEAREAIHHARIIWQMLDTETSRSEKTQAKYNILALIALHHTAALVWLVAGTEAQKDQSFCAQNDGSAGDFLLRRDNTEVLMNQFEDLYPKITSSWGQQSSFAKMVRALADNPFALNTQEQ
ncbi:uncharacterized protein RHO25_009140 [Cercospora beticola]|uniref:Xylanolytic transcriptional activator regulatory domain-containing protein n=1 Tax=Cercospora beticola TaxID=122368 RepID=A0ABZ0NY42_CERBT|nr:hypothetical protein RHO25_009140 [Cercospora beticola]